MGNLSIAIEDETERVEEEETEPHPVATVSSTLETSDTGDDASAPGEAGDLGTDDPSGGTSGSRGDTWMPDSLTEAFEQAAEAEGEAGTGDGGYGSRPTYEVQTESGETVKLGRGEAVYWLDDSPDADQSYSWTVPSQIEPGDEIVVLAPDFVRPRWEEWLKSQYEQQFDDPEAVFQGLYDWWAAMNDILRKLERKTRSVGGRGDPVLRAFYEGVKNEGVDKHKQAVRLWIKAIEETGAPIELATEPDATIGPDRAADIEAIGRAFDDSQLKDRQMPFNSRWTRSVVVGTGRLGAIYCPLVIIDLKGRGESPCGVGFAYLTARLML